MANYEVAASYKKGQLNVEREGGRAYGLNAIEGECCEAYIDTDNKQ